MAKIAGPTEVNQSDAEAIAQRAMIQAAEHVRDVSGEHLTAQAELADLESRSSREGSAREWGRKLSDAREVLGVLLRRIETARQEHHTAIVAHRRAQAIRPREEAERSRKQAQDLRVKAAPLLDALQGLEGCDWAPAPMSISVLSAGVVGGGLAPTMIPQQIPKSEQLLREAADHESLAAQIEAAAANVPASGHVEGATLSELVDAIFATPGCMGPRIAEVAAWTVRARDRETARRVAEHRRRPYAVDEAQRSRQQFERERLAQIDRRFPKDSKDPEIAEKRSGELRVMERLAEVVADEVPAALDAPMRFSLTWTDGAIDEETSRATPAASVDPVEKPLAQQEAI